MARSAVIDARRDYFVSENRRKTLSVKRDKLLNQKREDVP